MNFCQSFCITKVYFKLGSNYKFGRFSSSNEVVKSGTDEEIDGC